MAVDGARIPPKIILDIAGVQAPGLKVDCGHKIDVPVNGHGVATMRTVQQADALPFRDVWEIATIIPLKPPGGRITVLAIFTWLPNKITRGIKNRGNFASNV